MISDYLCCGKRVTFTPDSCKIRHLTTYLATEHIPPSIVEQMNSFTSQTNPLGNT